MRGNLPKRVLLVEAHPDDGMINAGGTLAQMVDQGAEVHFLTVNDGERGFMNRSFKDPEAVRKIARGEARRATKLLGAKEDVFLGYENHAVDFTQEIELKGKIMEQIRRIKPNIVMTFDPYGMYEPNIDHRVVAYAAYDAATFSQHHMDFPEQIRAGLEPHIVDELWFFSSPQPNHVVDITPYLSIKLRCMLEYKIEMEAMTEEVRQRLKAVRLKSPLTNASLQEKVAKFWLSGNFENGRHVEKFKIIRPFISERVPHLYALGLVEPDLSDEA